MSEHIHEDSFFCGGAVVKKVDDFFLECRARGRQMTGKKIIGGDVKCIGKCDKYINAYLTLAMFNVIEMSP